MDDLGLEFFDLLESIAQYNNFINLIICIAAVDGICVVAIFYHCRINNGSMFAPSYCCKYSIPVDIASHVLN